MPNVDLIPKFMIQLNSRSHFCNFFAYLFLKIWWIRPDNFKLLVSNIFQRGDSGTWSFIGDNLIFILIILYFSRIHLPDLEYFLELTFIFNDRLLLFNFFSFLLPCFCFLLWRLKFILIERSYRNNIIWFERNYFKLLLIILTLGFWISITNLYSFFGWLFITNIVSVRSCHDFINLFSGIEFLLRLRISVWWIKTLVKRITRIFLLFPSFIYWLLHINVPLFSSCQFLRHLNF